MRSLLIGMGLALASAVGLSLAACQSSPPRETPGALPAPRSDVTPRLNASTFVAHGHLLEQQGNLEQAVEQYRRALEVTPNLSAARNRLGITLNKLGEYGLAAAEFRTAIEQQPTAAHLYNNLGFSLYLDGQLASAESAFARAIELQPTFRRAQMNHGLVLARLGRDDEALAAFNLSGPQPDAYYNLAVVQADTGRYAAAARSLQRALELNADFAAARMELRAVARLAAEQEEAAAAQTAIAEAETETLTEEPSAASEAPEPITAVDSPEPIMESPDAALVLDAEQVEPPAGAANDPAEPLWEPLQTEIAGSVDPFINLFDDLIAALAGNAPWYEETVCRVYEWLGEPLDEPAVAD